MDLSQVCPPLALKPGALPGTHLPLSCQSLFFLSSKQLLIAPTQHEKLSQETTAGRKKHKQNQNQTNKKEETEETLACSESDVEAAATFKTWTKKAISTQCWERQQF